MKMKKKWWSFVVVLGVVLSLAACGKKEETSSDSVLKVGASPTPHAEILEHVKPKLAEEGIDLEIVTFEDYVLPNKSLAEKEIDANYFQHIPFFNLTVKENGYDFVNKAPIHIELMGLYSQRIKDVKELKDGATIIASNSESDWGRIITILQEAGLVKVKEGTDLLTATFEDIEENPKNLVFKNNVNPELLAAAYQNDEADLIAINANFAEGVGLTPEKDAVLVEQDNSPYANILAVRKEDENDPRVNALLKALQDPDTQKWIEDKWNGKIKPVSK